MNVLQEIFIGLKHNKLRTALTGLSVSWGIFILIVLLGAGNGLKNGVMSNFNKRATNSVTLWSGNTSLPYKGFKSGRWLQFEEKNRNYIDENLSEISASAATVRKNLNIVYKNEYGNYTVSGVEPVFSEINHLQFEAGNGRFFNNLDLKQSRKVIVLDKKVAETLLKTETPLGKYVQVGNVMFQVVGINSKKERWGNGEAYIPFTTAQQIFNPSHKFNNITMLVNDLKTTEENDAFNKKITEKAAQTMQFDPNDTQAIWVWNAQREYIETMKIFGGISIFVTIIGLFTLIAGIVGISNIMLVTVKERTREIGIRKAIGAPPRAILTSIVIESIIITTIFGYVGMLAGIGLTEVVNFFLAQTAAANPEGMSVFKNPTVEMSYIITATVILVISGVIAGYLPARRAVKIKPIEAMREN